MKKYLVGLFAVILAVGFSAFTSNDTKNSGLFWYEWDVANNKLGSFIMQSAIPPTLCPKEVNKNCARAYVNEQDEFQTPQESEVDYQSLTQ
jgi:hypothetical protein